VPQFDLTCDTMTGSLLLEHPERLPRGLQDRLVQFLGQAQDIGCARPSALLVPPPATHQERAEQECLRVAGYIHNSLVEGPGRRSSVLLSGCDLACHGCWVPQLHPLEAGTVVAVDRLAEAVLDPAYARDGVSILGGEPLLQLGGSRALVRALRARGCGHIVLYSGRTYQELCRRAQTQPAIRDVLDDVDVLIDGPYVAARAPSAGAWTGSGNQRVIDLVATRRTGRVVLLAPPRSADGAP